jgi:hypothetical protein
MLMDLTPPSKDTIWQTGLKRKIKQSLVYRRIISLTGNKYWLRVKSWKKIYQANGPLKQAGVAILTLDKIDFKRDKEGHFILIKGEIHQKEITLPTYMHPTSVHPISSNIL